MEMPADAKSVPLINRSSFPPDFLFGAASSAYQYEGAAKEGGKGPSIWDDYTQKYHVAILDGKNGDKAVDFYHRYKEDIKLMKEQGFNGFRFSIAWSRILPQGKLSKGVNEEGIAFYNNLINELLAHGVQPVVTLFHWDTPLALENEYGGFRSPCIVDDFRDYAELCFKNYGDRVKIWATMNEPWTFAYTGYDRGVFAPGRCSEWMDEYHIRQKGDSATEPYLVAHHMLLAHAKAAKLYREHYQGLQKGKIGMALVTRWFEPDFDTEEDKEAAQRALDFMFGWFMHPLTRGEYPESMRRLVGNRLPEFKPEEAAMVKGSIDFVGLNYYTTSYVANIPEEDYEVSPTKRRYGSDSHVRWSATPNKADLFGPPTSSPHNSYIAPNGLHKLLVHIKENCNNPTIYIMENGMYDLDTATLHEEGTNDSIRVDFIRLHLEALHAALKAEVKVEGYFFWSLLDNFEWASGYTKRYGLYYVDYEDDLKRIPKSSALWVKKFLLDNK